MQITSNSSLIKRIQKCNQKELKEVFNCPPEEQRKCSFPLIQRPASRWNRESQLVIKSTLKSITHFLTQSAFSKLIKGPNWWTHLELQAGSWLWWQWRSHSWPGCCRQSCCLFPPCRSLRECKPWLALTHSHRGYLRRHTNKWKDVKTLVKYLSVNHMQDVVKFSVVQILTVNYSFC